MIGGIHHGSYTIPRKKHRKPKPSRDELIAKYAVNTGMFGSYAEWRGMSVSYYLKKAGYGPLTEAEQKRYRCY